MIGEFKLKRWVLFTTYGWMIGILIVVSLAALSEAVFNIKDESGGQAVVGIGMGAGVGMMQWLVLRKNLNGSFNLFLSALIGFSVAFIIRDMVASQLNSGFMKLNLSIEVTIPFAVILGACISGWFQHWLVFKTSGLPAGSYLLYTMTGWFLATIVTMSLFMFNFQSAKHLPKLIIALLALLFLSIGGPILGWITGQFLMRHLKEKTSV